MKTLLLDCSAVLSAYRQTNKYANILTHTVCIQYRCSLRNLTLTKSTQKHSNEGGKLLSAERAEECSEEGANRVALMRAGAILPNPRELPSGKSVLSSEYGKTRGTVLTDLYVIMSSL